MKSPLRKWMWGFMLAWAAMTLLTSVAVVVGRKLPRGAEIVYTASSTRGLYFVSQIDLLDVNRTLSTPLTPNNQGALAPTWSPDGEHIAFVSDRDDRLSLYIVDANGSHITPTSTQLTSFGNTAWLPDGHRIVFRSRVAGSPKLALFDVDSGASYVLNITGSSDSPVSWSPDSKWLIYISYRDGNPRLYVVDPDCNVEPNGCKYNERGLLQSDYVRWPPAWSPDGKRLVFTGISRSDTELYMVDVDCAKFPTGCTGNEVALTDNQVDDYAPAWSPDGKTIAFLSDHDSKTSIYLIDVASSTTRRLNEESFNSHALLWSPDSRNILLAAVQEGQSILYSVDAETGATQRLTGHNQSGVEPAWRP